MPLRNEKDIKKVKRTVALYNMVPNIIWSLINPVPVSIYCFTLLNYKTFYIFLVVSLVPVFLKNSFLDKLQLGKTIRFYKRLGVHFVNKVAQNGVMINNLIKKKFPGYKMVTHNRSSVAALIAQTYIFEKFHLILFLFFSFVMINAFIEQHWAWAFIILSTNIAYNIYPNLLQQYIRLKLKLFSERMDNR